MPQIQFSLIKKIKIGHPEHSLTPTPLRLITSHFCLPKIFFAKSKYVSLIGDSSETWKTWKEKELVYGKVLLLLKGYQPLKAFGGLGGPTVDGTKEAMLHASYNVCENMLEQIVYLCSDWASVNFGRHQGALVQISDMVEGCNPLLVYCLNHCLELAIKDAYKKIAVLMT